MWVRVSLFSTMVWAAFGCDQALVERGGPQPSPTRTRTATPGAPVGDDTAYVGSQACSACHLEHYQAWQSTSHQNTVRSAAEAQADGFLLPSGASWKELSYVIGGGERVSYADASGRVLTTSYHRRMESWDGFPAGELHACAPCHFTGVGAGPDHPNDPAFPGRWVETGIACESCHGPGGRHVTTHDRNDIVVDRSNRGCGHCHTSVGRILPEDEWYETHDLVQNWNRDPHVAGGKFHSQTVFCAGCHAPEHGGGIDAAASAPVFSEEMKNVSCVGCHDPHAVTEASPGSASWHEGPPVPSNLHAYRGDDHDFTTNDFETRAGSNDLCLQCHRGADRVELDHGAAGCTDCHNSFRANRGPRSIIEHDANQPELSCRPCHDDADHLMAVLYLDPAFLEPNLVHDLTTLPESAIAKFALDYPAMALVYTPTPWLGVFGIGPDAEPDARASTEVEPRLDAASSFLVARFPDPRVDRPSERAEDVPGVPTRFVDGVHALEEGRYGEGAEAIEAALDDGVRESTVRAAVAIGHMRERRYLHARRELEVALARDPDDAILRYYLGHVFLGTGALQSSIRAFETARSLAPDSLPIRYTLARAYRQSGLMDDAIRTYRELVSEAPDPFEAHVRLSRLFKYLSDRNHIQFLHASETAAPPRTGVRDWRRHLDELQQAVDRLGRMSLSHLGEALRLRPADVTLKQDVAEILRRSGELDRAEAYFRWLSENRPEEWLPLYRLGTILIRRERFDEAVEVLARATAAAPAEGDAHSALGLALARLGKLDTAVVALESAAIHSPFDPGVHTNLGAAYASRGELDRAERSLRRSLELRTFPLPRVHLSYMNLALIQRRRGRHEDARTSLEMALHAYPDFELAREVRAAADRRTFPFVFNDLLERFGEVSTVELE